MKISQPPVDEEEADIPSLKMRLAALNVSDSSPDHSGMPKPILSTCI